MSGVRQQFAGYCEPCEWEGPIRADNLRADSDLEKHLTGSDHAALRSNAKPEPGDLIVGTFDQRLRVVELRDVDLTDGIYAVEDGNGDLWHVERDKASDSAAGRAWVAV